MKYKHRLPYISATDKFIFFPFKKLIHEKKRCHIYYAIYQ